MQPEQNPLEGLSVFICLWLGVVGVLWLALLIMQKVWAK